MRIAAALALLGFVLGVSVHTSSQAQTVTLAGLAFSGDSSSKAERFPYSVRYEKSLKDEGQTAFKRIQSLVSARPPKTLTLSGNIDDLKGRDQAIVTALVVTSETVSLEQFGPVTKFLALIGAQALFFDFKSQTVLRAYPLSFAYIDTLDHRPSDAEVLSRVKLVYEGALSKAGIFERYATALANATLPAQVPRLMQVAKVTLSPEVLAVMPESLKRTPQAAQHWAADIVAESLSSRTGVPLIPYAESEAINQVMTVQVSDGDVYNLKLPSPDYPVSVTLSGLKKLKYGQTGAGTSFIYGAYASVRIEEPLSGKVYLDTALKNGEVKVVPATQTFVDDFPAFYDSINGLFNKLAEAVAGKADPWVKTAAATPDIDKQLLATRELISLCK